MAVTNAKSWKAGLARELELPSGNVALVRRVGLDTFLREGRVPNSLLPMMRGALAGKRPELKNDDLTADMLNDMLTMTDTVVVSVVVEPRVQFAPQVGNERDPEALYIDEVDLTDKQFIFQWALGGTSDVEKFRDQSRQLMVALQPGEGVALPTE